MAKKQNSRTPVSRESDDLIFAVCERFFSRIKSADAGEGEADEKKKKGRRARSGGAAAVAKEIAEEFNRPDLTRERIYPLLWEAINRDFLVMNAPLEVGLRTHLVQKYNLREHLDNVGGEVTVVNTPVGDISEHVNAAAADVIINLIDKVEREKKAKAKAEGRNVDEVRVNLGFGAGYAAEEVAKRLSTRASAKAPKLTLHALTCGGQYLAGQQKVPTTYFSYFEGKVRDANFIGMFAPTVVQNDQYDALKSNPSLQFAYSERDKIDILVTSLGTSVDAHCLLRQYYSHLKNNKLVNEDLLKSLESQGWVGDVMFQPYSNEKPIQAQSLRYVTLFDFEEMLAFSRRPGKYVVVTCAPCRGCQQRKTMALRPLLSNPDLRLWTHLVLDHGSAEELTGHIDAEQ